MSCGAVWAALYEQNQQLSAAKELTEKALLLSQSLNASDITYRWQWQLGRILKAEGDISGARAAYTEAVKILKSLRSDLVAISSDVQFSFRESDAILVIFGAPTHYPL